MAVKDNITQRTQNKVLWWYRHAETMGQHNCLEQYKNMHNLQNNGIWRGMYWL